MLIAILYTLYTITIYAIAYAIILLALVYVFLYYNIDPLSTKNII